MNISYSTSTTSCLMSNPVQLSSGLQAFDAEYSNMTCTTIASTTLPEATTTTTMTEVNFDGFYLFFAFCLFFVSMFFITWFFKRKK